MFYGHGTSNAMEEAIFIIFTVLDMDFNCPQESLNARVSQDDQEAINSIVEQRIDTRKPAAYLLNRAWFYGLPFYVNEHVLVPRSPIAELIETQFQPWIEVSKVKQILDLGTGSGCIAIATAYAFPDAEVDAVDIDENTLLVAKKNIQAHGMENRVSAFKSDLFSKVTKQNYDIIISNPPYVSDEEMKSLPEEYQYEPRHGLRADDQGLALVHTILQESVNHLSSNGILITEVGFNEENLVKAYPEIPFFWFEFERGGQGVFMLNKEQLGSIKIEA